MILVPGLPKPISSPGYSIRHMGGEIQYTPIEEELEHVSVSLRNERGKIICSQPNQSCNLTLLKMRSKISDRCSSISELIPFD
jgi:hypothetical protein